MFFYFNDAVCKQGQLNVEGTSVANHLFYPGVAYQCYHGFMRAVQEGNIQWESRTYPYPGTPITQRFSHSQYTHLHAYASSLLNTMVMRRNIETLSCTSSLFPFQVS